MEVSPSRSLGSFEPCAWRMNVRRMPSAPPNSPASNTTLSRGDAWPDWGASVVVQSSWANTNAAKSTSWESSTSRSRVDLPGVERGRPGLDVGDVHEPARDRLEQFGLLARRSDEDARLVHARFMMTDRRTRYAVRRCVHVLRALNNPDLLPGAERSTLRTSRRCRRRASNDQTSLSQTAIRSPSPRPSSPRR